eukprot:s718_g26.t1
MAPSSGLLPSFLLCAVATFVRAHEHSPESSPTLVLPQLGRRQRRHLTAALNSHGAGVGPPLWDPLLPWRHSTHLLKLSRHRGPLIRRQHRAFSTTGGRAHWSGWPSRGRRIGEASNPGPPTASASSVLGRERSPARPASTNSRVYCPVPGCLCADPARARGWATIASMRHHIDAHLAGSVAGDVPNAWLETHHRTRCLVCGLSVSANHGVHPTCRPQARIAAVDAAPAMDVDGLQLPTLTDIQSARTPTLRHVPKPAQHTWGQVLARTLATVAHSNDDKAWRELMMLPQAVLCSPQRGGRRHQKAAAAYTLDRLHRWQEGERLSLWQSRPSPRKGSSDRPSVEQRRELAIGLAREGFDRKACTASLSQGLCPADDSTLQQLKALHPESTPPPAQHLGDLPVPPEVAPDLLTRCLRAFPAETAPGPSGLRVQHLRDACPAGGSEAVVAQLCAVVNLLAQGRAPDYVAPVLAGASLVALPKPNGGVGVAVPGGTEKVIHTVRAWWQRYQLGPSPKLLIKLDFANAFNTVNRDAILPTVRDQFPALARWTTWCYRQPSRLQFATHTLESQSGVQQGDPLGPLLFSAALQPLASDLRQCGLDIAVHYLDDGVLAGDITAVSQALQLVQHRAAAIGLQLNLSKCDLVAVGAVDLAGLHMQFPDALLRAADGSSKVCRNFELLGGAVGDDEYVHQHTVERAAKVGDLLDAVGELPDPQV